MVVDGVARGHEVVLAGAAVGVGRAAPRVRLADVHERGLGPGHDHKAAQR